ncbi:hypothetical protein AAHC03_017223 [Spirometra sp. Aus1]
MQPSLNGQLGGCIPYEISNNTTSQSCRQLSDIVEVTYKAAMCQVLNGSRCFTEDETSTKTLSDEIPITALSHENGVPAAVSHPEPTESIQEPAPTGISIFGSGQDQDDRILPTDRRLEFSPPKDNFGQKFPPGPPLQPPYEHYPAHEVYPGPRFPPSSRQPQWGAGDYREGGPAVAHHFPHHEQQQQPPAPRPYFQHPDQYGGSRPRFPGPRLPPPETPPFDDHHPRPPLSPHHQPSRRPHPVYVPHPSERFPRPGAQGPAPYPEDYRQRPVGGIVSRDYVVYDPHGNYDESLNYAAPDYEPTDDYHHARDEAREPIGADFGGPEGQPYEMPEYPAVGPPPPAAIFPSTVHPSTVVDPAFYQPPRGPPTVKPFVAPGLSIPDHLIPAFKDAAVSSGAWPPTADVSAAAAAASAGVTARRKGLPAWLREELERLEKKKAKDVARGNRDLSPTADVNRDDEGDVVMDEAVNTTTTTTANAAVSSHKSPRTVLSDEEGAGGEEDLERPTNRDNVVDSLTGSMHGVKSISSAVSSPDLGVLNGAQDLRALNSPAGGLTEAEFRTLFRGLPAHIRQAEVAQFITRTLTDALLCVTTELLVLVAQEAHAEVRAVRVREAEEVARRAAEEHRAALLRKSAQRNAANVSVKSNSGDSATPTLGLTGLVAYGSESEAESETADETAPPALSEGKTATTSPESSPLHRQQQPQEEQEQLPEANSTTTTASPATEEAAVATVEVSETMIPSESKPAAATPSPSVSKTEKKSAKVSEKPSTVKTPPSEAVDKSASVKTHQKSSSKHSPVKEKTSTPHSRHGDEKDGKKPRAEEEKKQKKKTHSTPLRGRHRDDVEETKKGRHKKRPSVIFERQLPLDLNPQSTLHTLTHLFCKMTHHPPRPSTPLMSV